MTDLFIGKVPGAISACLNSDHVYRKGKTVNKYIKRLWGIVIVLLIAGIGIMWISPDSGISYNVMYQLPFFSM